MNASIEEWDRQARQSTSNAHAARRHAERMRRERRFFYLIAAGVVAIVAALTWAGKVHARPVTWDASIASVFDIDAEPALACPRYAGLTVAHRSLPCGTRVRFMYRGRKRDARVSDRGPYANGATWDLDRDLQVALGFPYCVAQIRARVIR